jgi:hypothetical protein
MTEKARAPDEEGPSGAQRGRYGPRKAPGTLSLSDLPFVAASSLPVIARPLVLKPLGSKPPFPLVAIPSLSVIVRPWRLKNAA